MMRARSPTRRTRECTRNTTNASLVPPSRGSAADMPRAPDGRDVSNAYRGGEACLLGKDDGMYDHFALCGLVWDVGMPPGG